MFDLLRSTVLDVLNFNATTLPLTLDLLGGESTVVELAVPDLPVITPETIIDFVANPPPPAGDGEDQSLAELAGLNGRAADPEGAEDAKRLVRETRRSVESVDGNDYGFLSNVMYTKRIEAYLGSMSRLDAHMVAFTNEVAERVGLDYAATFTLPIRDTLEGASFARVSPTHTNRACVTLHIPPMQTVRYFAGVVIIRYFLDTVFNAVRPRILRTAHAFCHNTHSPAALLM